MYGKAGFVDSGRIIQIITSDVFYDDFRVNSHRVVNDIWMLPVWSDGAIWINSCWLQIY